MFWAVLCYSWPCQAMPQLIFVVNGVIRLLVFRCDCGDWLSHNVSLDSLDRQPCTALLSHTFLMWPGWHMHCVCPVASSPSLVQQWMTAVMLHQYHMWQLVIVAGSLLMLMFSPQITPDHCDWMTMSLFMYCYVSLLCRVCCRMHRLMHCERAVRLSIISLLCLSELTCDVCSMHWAGY